MADRFGPGSVLDEGDWGDISLERLGQTPVLQPPLWPDNPELPQVKAFAEGPTPAFAPDNGNIVGSVDGVANDRDAEVDGYYWQFGPNDESVATQTVLVHGTGNTTLNLSGAHASFGDDWWVCVRTFKDQTRSPARCNTFHAEAPTGTPDPPTLVEGDVSNLSAAQQRVAPTAIDPDADTTDVQRSASGGTFFNVATGLVASEFPRDFNTDPDTNYCYRLRSHNDEGTSGFSATVCRTTPPSPSPGQGGPNNPGLPVVMVAHDFSAMPTQSLQMFAASGGGFLHPWHFSGQAADMERNYLGGGNQAGLTGSVSASTAIVTHGPQNPHGRAHVWRHRLPAGMGTDTGTAAGNGGGVDFRPHNSTFPQFRRYYCHYWVLYEGHLWNDQRVLSHAGYRMSREVGAGRRTNQYSFFQDAHSGGPKRNAITNTCSHVRGPDASDQYEPITHTTPAIHAPPNVSNFSDAPHCTGTSADYSNWLTGAVRGWVLGHSTNQCKAVYPSATSSSCIQQVGRWHRHEILLDLGTPDTPNGSFRFYLDGTLRAELSGVRMLSDIWDGDPGHPKPNQGYIYKTVWSHYHPGGSAAEPRPKPFTDYVCYADFFMTGVPF